MNEQIEAVADHLRPLLLEARNLMHLQDRAIASGIRIDSGFVRCRIDGWEHAIGTAHKMFAHLLETEDPAAAGINQNRP